MKHCEFRKKTNKKNMLFSGLHFEFNNVVFFKIKKRRLQESPLLLKGHNQSKRHACEHESRTCSLHPVLSDWKTKTTHTNTLICGVNCWICVCLEKFYLKFSFLLFWGKEYASSFTKPSAFASLSLHHLKNSMSSEGWGEEHKQVQQ